MPALLQCYPRHVVHNKQTTKYVCNFLFPLVVISLEQVVITMIPYLVTMLITKQSLLQILYILQQTCSHQPISGWVCMAFLTTSLLHVDCQNLLSTDLLQVFSTGCDKSANDKFHQAIF